MARKKRPESENRTAYISAWLTQVDKDAMKIAAKSANCTVSEWLREAVAEKIERDTSDVDPFTGERPATSLNESPLSP